MVFEFSNSAPPFYTFEQRNALRAGSVPGGTIVWLARYGGDSFMSTAVAEGLDV